MPILLFILTDCADTDTAADKSVMEESDYNRNQTIGVYDQVITPGGSDHEKCEDTMEKLHSSNIHYTI